jgi:hypothetical protein
MEQSSTLQRAVALCCALLVLPFSHLCAQSIHSGTVVGVVKDPTGSVAPGAKVNLKNPVTGYEQNTITRAGVSKAEIARRLNIGRTSVRRILG